MKHISRTLFALGLALALSSASHAAIGQVKNLSAAGSSVICIPGATDQVIIIQNNDSANSIRISLDGGAGYTDPVTGKVGTNPTPSTGYLLKAGQQLVITTTVFNGQSQAGLHKPIVAISVSGSITSVDIVTDGSLTQFPTT